MNVYSGMSTGIWTLIGHRHQLGKLQHECHQYRRISDCLIAGTWLSTQQNFRFLLLPFDEFSYIVQHIFIFFCLKMYRVFQSASSDASRSLERIPFAEDEDGPLLDDEKPDDEHQENNWTWHKNKSPLLLHALLMLGYSIVALYLLRKTTRQSHQGPGLIYCEIT